MFRQVAVAGEMGYLVEDLETIAASLGFGPERQPNDRSAGLDSLPVLCARLPDQSLRISEPVARFHGCVAGGSR